MADSVTITVQVINPPPPDVQTYINNFDIQPRSGEKPFAITFTGYLSIYPTLLSDDPIVNGERISLQSFNGIDWNELGYATTEQREIPDPSAPSGVRLQNGHFELTFTITSDWPEGTYGFRAHYNGNTGKYLLGCEENDATVDVTTTTNGGANYRPWILSGLLAGLVAVVYIATKKK